MNLTTKDKQTIAALTSHPGYKLLLEAIQAEIDYLQDELQESDSETTDKRLVDKWRALRKTLIILKFKPQEIAEDLDQEKEEIEQMFGGPKSDINNLQELENQLEEED